jgi:hypothetical protein
MYLFMDERENTLPYRCRHGHLKTNITLALNSNMGFKGQMIKVNIPRRPSAVSLLLL